VVHDDPAKDGDGEVRLSNARRPDEAEPFRDGGKRIREFLRALHR
jgi:hypothetical protein